MFKGVIVQVGELIAYSPKEKMSYETVNESIRSIRKKFLNEFGRMPPAIEYKVCDGISHIGYGFEFEGFANTYHLIDEVDYMLETKEEMHNRIYFYLKRFLRKWYMGCPDMLLEEKLKDQAVVFEYGGGMAEIIETEGFYDKLEKTKEQMGLTNFEWSFWESEYVADKELVVYVYGKDYFVNNEFSIDIENTQEVIIRDIVCPILEENAGIF